MTDTTPNLALPEIAAAQAQKHVTHNEALRVLDAIVHLAVLDRDLVAPPETPAEGERWLVGTPAGGDWAGHDDEIAAWQDGGWQFYPPHVGWLAYVLDEEALLAWSGAAWEPALDLLGGASELQNMALLGVGTTADETNPLSAKLNNALWAARTVAEGGNGDLRYKLSKESEDKTLSLLFQDDFSGRAEIGLTGDDDFHFKVSDDGTIWRDAIVIDKSTGQVSFPQGGAAADLELTIAELAIGIADILDAPQFLGDSGNRFADSFDTLTYVDTGSATGLDSGAGLLKPSCSYTEQIIAGYAIDVGTASGSSIFQRNVTLTGGDVISKIGVYSAAARTVAVKIARRDSAGSYTVVVSEDFAHPGGGWSDGTLSTPYTVPGGGSYHAGAYSVSPTWPERSSASFDRAYKTTNLGMGSASGLTEDTGNGIAIRVQKNPSANNMVVTSAALTAASAPSTAKLVARVKEIDAITPDADLVFAASRDGGTSWADFTMTRRFTAAGISIYESAVLDISSQPSGTSMKWKAATANNKAVEIHGVYFSWM